MNLIDFVNSEYPRSLWQVRQANPNISFTANPTDEDLAPFGHANVYPTPQPIYDPRTERIEDVTSEPDADGIYHQQWTIRPATPEEIDAYDLAHLPEPNWMAFGIALAMNPGISDLYAAIPGPVANGLSIGLNEASKGDARLFSGLWLQVMTTGAITPELLAAITALAIEHNLPQAFILGLDPNQQTP